MPDLSALLDAIDGAQRFDAWTRAAVPAAKAIEQAVVDGARLGPLAERVQETCRQRSHVPLLAPLASALLLDALRRDDADALDALTGRALYVHGLRRAVLRAAPAGLSPGRLVVARSWYDAEKARHLAHTLVDAQPEQLVPLVRAFEADAVLAEEVPVLLRSLGSRGELDLAPALPHLAPFLTARAPAGPRLAALQVLARQARRGEDTRPLLRAVAATLPGLQSAAEQEAAARALSEGDPASAAALFARPEAAIRRGALSASTAPVDALARGLRDADPRTRDLCFRALEERGTPAATAETLCALAVAAPDGVAARYLRTVVQRDDGLRDRLLAAMPDGPLRRALAVGMPWCRSCSELKRRDSQESPARFPAGAAKLRPRPRWDAKGKPGPSPAAGVSRTELGSARCLACGWRYRLGREQDHRGIYDEVVYTLERLPPAADTYSAAERTALVDRLNRDLVHLEPAARAEAGWGLARLHLDGADWPAYRALLAHPRVEVRRSALEVLPWRDAPPVTLLGAVQDRLGDDDPGVRKGAARRLAACSVDALMRSDDPDVLAGAMDRLARDSTAAPAHMTRLFALLRHSDAHLVRTARRALVRALSDGLEVPTEPLVPLVLDQSSSPVTRGAALTLLETALRKRPDDTDLRTRAAALVPHLPVLLEGAREGEPALALGLLLSPFVDVRELLPAALSWIHGNRALARVSAFLLTALQGPTDRDALLHGYAHLLLSSWASTSASKLLALARCGDIAGAMPLVLRGLAADQSFTRDQCARMGVQQALWTNDADALMALLQHRSADIQLAAVSELSADERPPPAACVPALVALLDRSSAPVARAAARALARCAHPEAVQTARAGRPLTGDPP